MDDLAAFRAQCDMNIVARAQQLGIEALIEHETAPLKKRIVELETRLKESINAPWRLAVESFWGPEIEAASNPEAALSLAWSQGQAAVVKEMIAQFGDLKRAFDGSLAKAQSQIQRFGGEPKSSKGDPT